VKAVPSYHMMEYHFLNKQDEEIKLWGLNFFLH
jgi:hypothetical protein